MEIKGFDYFLNREKDKPCLVAGNAPTIRNFPFGRFKGKYFMVNSGPMLLNGLAHPDYWISANWQNPVPHLHYRKINYFRKCTFIFSDTAAYCQRHKYSRALIERRLKVDWFAFDERHINKEKCSPVMPCCELIGIYPERITIFEYIKQHFAMDRLCSKPTTSVVYALMFALLMGCSPIYLQGVELPRYTKNYFQYRMLHAESLRNIKYILRSYLREWLSGSPERTGFYDNRETTLGPFEYIIEICSRLGVEIYNLSPTSALNQIKILPYLDYRKVC